MHATQLQDKELDDDSVRNRRPTLADTAQLFEGPFGIRSLALSGLFILACFSALYFARDFFLPVMLAIVFNFLFAPLVRALKGFGIPGAVGSALVLVIILAFGGFLTFELSGPLTEWLEKSPEIGAKLHAKIQPLTQHLDKISNAGDEIERMERTKPEKGTAMQEVELKQSGLFATFFSQTGRFVFTMLVSIVLLYFLLASGDLFLTKLVHALPTLSDKKKAVRIATKSKPTFRNT